MSVITLRQQGGGGSFTHHRGPHVRAASGGAPCRRDLRCVLYAASASVSQPTWKDTVASRCGRLSGQRGSTSLTGFSADDFELPWDHQVRCCALPTVRSRAVPTGRRVRTGADMEIGRMCGCYNVGSVSANSDAMQVQSTLYSAISRVGRETRPKFNRASEGNGGGARASDGERRS